MQIPLFQKVAILAILLPIIIGNISIHVTYAQTVCGMSGEDLMACKPAVTLPHPPPPSGRCCSALAHADIRCLCTYKNSKLLPSLGIDPNLAIQLPDKCKLPHPAHC
ncbi:UNVERIFIED_CONTAM: hypothetical protein Scaly_0146500 [Sesamum calycinum]|uniref:Bifunctional inhibitor/plant lipid transfer protein/seed storage helical domain-containing protein n=4 Tax=Sesamum TaxID=4181 RepID=A0AAE1XFJ3_9LAMI|nr:hypothetical protein Sango_0121800 [Sesamum angolense]